MIWETQSLGSLNPRPFMTSSQVILYSFPAVCWVYGAGFIFSTFVSVVFWGSPALSAYEAIRAGISVVRIQALRVSGHWPGGRA